MDNQSEINNTCNQLNLFLNKKHVYQFKNSTDTVGTLGILPVHVALSIIDHIKMPDLVARINEANDMINYFHASKSEKHKTEQLIENITKNLLTQYELYTKLSKKYPKCFVYTDLKKMREDTLPTAKDFSKAFYNYVNLQLKAVNNLYKQANHTCDKAQQIANEAINKNKSYAHVLSEKEGELLFKLSNACDRYKRKFHDNDINVSGTIKKDTIDSVDSARTILSNKIGDVDSTNSKQHSLAKNYNFVVNECHLSDYIENKNKIALLTPDTVITIAYNTAIKAKKKRAIITKRICNALHLI